MTGTLYVIGVGPGDPELLTLKAVRILKVVTCICVPKGREEGSSMALNIIKKVISVDNKELIEAHFPMRKTKASAPGPRKNASLSGVARTPANWMQNGMRQWIPSWAFLTVGWMWHLLQ